MPRYIHISHDRDHQSWSLGPSHTANRSRCFYTFLFVCGFSLSICPSIDYLDLHLVSCYPCFFCHFNFGTYSTSTNPSPNRHEGFCLVSFILQLLGIQVSHGWAPWQPKFWCMGWCLAVWCIEMMRSFLARLGKHKDLRWKSPWFPYLFHEFWFCNIMAWKTRISITSGGKYSKIIAHVWSFLAAGVPEIHLPRHHV